MVSRFFVVSRFLLLCQQCIFLFHQNIDDLAELIYKNEISDGSWSQAQVRSRIRIAIGHLLRHHPDTIKKVFWFLHVLLPPLS